MRQWQVSARAFMSPLEMQACVSCLFCLILSTISDFSAFLQSREVVSFFAHAQFCFVTIDMLSSTNLCSTNCSLNYLLATQTLQTAWLCYRVIFLGTDMWTCLESHE